MNSIIADLLLIDTIMAFLTDINASSIDEDYIDVINDDAEGFASVDPRTATHWNIDLDFISDSSSGEDIDYCNYVHHDNFSPPISQQQVSNSSNNLILSTAHPPDRSKIDKQRKVSQG